MTTTMPPRLPYHRHTPSANFHRRTRRPDLPSSRVEPLLLVKVALVRVTEQHQPRPDDQREGVEGFRSGCLRGRVAATGQGWRRKASAMPCMRVWSSGNGTQPQERRGSEHGGTTTPLGAWGWDGYGGVEVSGNVWAGEGMETARWIEMTTYSPELHGMLARATGRT
jgi:hypothetical protein